MIDYIFYSAPTIAVEQLLGQVDPEYLERVPGFPNWHFPSDHLALLAKFIVKDRKEVRKAIERGEVDFGGSSRDRR